MFLTPMFQEIVFSCECGSPFFDTLVRYRRMFLFYIRCVFSGVVSSPSEFRNILDKRRSRVS